VYKNYQKKKKGPKGKRSLMYKAPRMAPMALVKKMFLPENIKKRIEERRKIVAERRAKKKEARHAVFETFEESGKKKILGKEVKEAEEELGKKPKKIEKEEIKKLKLKTKKLGKEELFERLEGLGKKDEGFQKLIMMLKKKQIKPTTEAAITIKRKRLIKRPLLKKERFILPELKTKKEIKESKEDIFKKLGELIKGKEKPVEALLDITKKTPKEQIISIFADMSEKKPISANLFKEILYYLMKTGKVSKHDVSEILFDFMKKGYITKKEVVNILSDLKII